MHNIVKSRRHLQSTFLYSNIRYIYIYIYCQSPNTCFSPSNPVASPGPGTWTGGSDHIYKKKVWEEEVKYKEKDKEGSVRKQLGKTCQRKDLKKLYYSRLTPSVSSAVSPYGKTCPGRSYCVDCVSGG